MTPPMGRSERPQGARVSGLESFATPTLEKVERRRFQLWVLTLLLLAVLALALALLTVLRSLVVPAWLTPRTAQVGLLTLIALFSAYALIKERELARLSERLVREKVLTATLTGRIDELTSLLDAAKAINVELDLQQVLGAILRNTLDLLNARDGSIMLVRGESGLQTVAVAGESAARGAHLRLGEAIAGRVAASREPVLVHGTVVRPPGPGTIDTIPPPHSAMSTPLLHRGRLLGVLNVNAIPERKFTEHDLRALSLFAEHAAGAIANAQLFESQRLLAAQKNYRAFHDALTNLPNRPLFLEHLSYVLSRRREGDALAAVLFLDIDDFKTVNDRFGHAGGDELLRSIAKRLRESIREGDIVARFGGDEFAVLADGLRSIEDARLAAGRVLDYLAVPFSLQGENVEVHASIGIALQEPGKTSAEDLLRRGDAAMHATKREAKGGIRVFEESQSIEISKAMDLAGTLPAALDNGQILTVYQPIVILESGVPIAIEAIPRWRHPTRGLLAAGEFLPHVHQPKLLAAVEIQTLREGTRLLARVSREGVCPPDFRLAVKVSSATWRAADFAGRVGEILGSTGLEPGRLTLEITEGAFMRDLEAVLSELQILKDLGLRISLDNFGIGYTSLGRLHSLPVDELRIDHTFVEGIETDLGAEAVVQAVVKMGEVMILDVIADGVASKTQVDRLVELQCRFGQGPFFSPPVEPPVLLDFLQKSG